MSWLFVLLAWWNGYYAMQAWDKGNTHDFIMWLLLAAGAGLTAIIEAMPERRSK